MLNVFYNWINRIKDKENVIIMLFKILYNLSSYEWLHTIINVILTLFLTSFFEDNSVGGLYGVLFAMILIEIFYYTAASYRRYKYQIQRNSDLILNEIMTAMIALDDYVNSNEGIGKGVFEYASGIVTSSMYKILKDVTGCETRISVIQQFHVDEKHRKCMMISRKSKKRTSCVKKETLVEYTNKKNYYFLKILSDNKDIYVFFDTKEKIDKTFFWKNNKKKSNIYQYIGLAEKIKTDDIAFLLQIDAMEKNAFGKNNDELSVFAENYIDPYIQFLRHAYNIERWIRKVDEK